MDLVNFTSNLPSAAVFRQLRNTSGWGQISAAQAKASLTGSLGGICAIRNSKIIGMARYIGDGVLNIYIQDVIIAQNYRGNGVGRNMLSELFRDLQTRYPANCTIGLMAAKGQASFYAQFGFIRRPSDVYGAGMIAPLGDISLTKGKGTP